MIATITEREFLEVVNGGKRPAEIIQHNGPNQQLIVGWYVKGTSLMVKVYSSVFGPKGYGQSRGVGKDSIRICLVDTEAKRGIGRASYTTRTSGWDRRLKEKIRSMFNRAYAEIEARNENPACPCCGSSMHLRQAKKGAAKGTCFYGCADFPNCKGTRPATPALNAFMQSA